MIELVAPKLPSSGSDPLKVGTVTVFVPVGFKNVPDPVFEFGN